MHPHTPIHTLQYLSSTEDSNQNNALSRFWYVRGKIQWLNRDLSWRSRDGKSFWCMHLKYKLHRFVFQLQVCILDNLYVSKYKWVAPSCKMSHVTVVDPYPELPWAPILSSKDFSNTHYLHNTWLTCHKRSNASFCTTPILLTHYTGFQWEKWLQSVGTDHWDGGIAGLWRKSEDRRCSYRTAWRWSDDEACCANVNLYEKGMERQAC